MLKSPWELILTEPVPEVVEFRSADWAEKYFSAQSARSSSRVTLSTSYTKQFSSSIDILAWPVQRNGKVVVKNFRKKYSTKPRKSQALKYCFCLRGKLVEYPRLLLISPRSLSNF